MCRPACSSETLAPPQQHLFAFPDVALGQHGEGTAGIRILHLCIAACVVRSRQPCSR
jgi:hypothetical protein